LNGAEDFDAGIARRVTALGVDLSIYGIRQDGGPLDDEGDGDEGGCGLENQRMIDSIAKLEEAEINRRAMAAEERRGKLATLNTPPRPHERKRGGAVLRDNTAELEAAEEHERESAGVSDDETGDDDTGDDDTGDDDRGHDGNAGDDSPPSAEMSHAKRRRGELTREQELDVIRRYHAGEKTEALGREFGHSAVWIYGLLDRHGQPRRPPAVSQGTTRGKSPVEAPLVKAPVGIASSVRAGDVTIGGGSKPAKAAPIDQPLTWGRLLNTEGRTAAEPLASGAAGSVYEQPSTTRPQNSPHAAERPAAEKLADLDRLEQAVRERGERAAARLQRDLERDLEAIERVREMVRGVDEG
jgi:hypothetical protein